MNRLDWRDSLRPTALTLSDTRLSVRLRRALRRWDLVAGAAILLVLLVIVIWAPWLAPHDPEEGNLAQRLAPPVWDGGTWADPLGTDSLGRDLFSRILVGGRISVLVGVSSVVLQGMIGTGIGLVAGYQGGWVDNLSMRLADIQLSIPFLVLAIAVAAAVGPGIVNVILVLGFTGWAGYARIARGATLQVVGSLYVEAARAAGQSWPGILTRHILVNISSSLVVTATFEAARMIIAESSLSFLGLGVPPEVPSWGSMVAAGRDLMTGAWWVSTMPGLAITITTIGINLAGNGLRDLMDPRGR